VIAEGMSVVAFIAALAAGAATTTTTAPATTTTTTTAAPDGYRLAVSSVRDRMTVYLGGNVDAPTSTAVRSAVDQIDSTTGVHWSVSTGDGNVRPGQVQVNAGDPTVGCEAGDFGCTRWVIHGGAVEWASVTISPSTPPRILVWVVLHELGHAVGLAHSPYPADVMTPGQLTFTVYQPGDLAGLRALRIETTTEGNRP
jgi:uncharacterized protein (DUF2342 family)